jgi:predicted transcriptional regulator
MRRGRTTRDVPPPLELECLCVLWSLGEANVAAVRDQLAPRRALAYTTVMTMLDRLARKSVVSRRKVGRSYLYTAALSRDEVRGRAIRELVDSLFEGRTDDLRRYLSGTANTVAVPAGASDGEVTLDAALL